MEAKENMRAYVYTLTHNGGLKEYTGYFKSSKYDHCWMFIKDSGGYLTTVYPIEGTAYGQSIWFNTPNPEGAIKAFSERALRLKEEYTAKCINQERYILKQNKVN